MVFQRASEKDIFSVAEAVRLSRVSFDGGRCSQEPRPSPCVFRIEFDQGVTESHLEQVGKRCGNSRTPSKTKPTHEKRSRAQGVRTARQHARGAGSCQRPADVEDHPGAAPGPQDDARGHPRLRRTLKASTPVFAAYLNVTPDTVRSWEKNRRQPSRFTVGTWLGCRQVGNTCRIRLASAIAHRRRVSNKQPSQGLRLGALL
jgi:hypothetical protein